MRYADEAAAVAAALTAGSGEGGIDLRPYRCDRCRRYHLTSRLKGQRGLRAITRMGE